MVSEELVPAETICMNHWNEGLRAHKDAVAGHVTYFARLLLLKPNTAPISSAAAREGCQFHCC